MSDYNAYVTSINKIFDYLSKMKVGWSSLDNKNYIESIEEYKKIVVDNANQFKNEVKEVENLETLGND